MMQHRDVNIKTSKMLMRAKRIKTPFQKTLVNLELYTYLICNT